MEEKNSFEQEDLSQHSLKKQLTTATRLSKYVTIFLFITLPFIGGYVGYKLGYKYSPEKVIEVEKIVEVEVETEKDAPENKEVVESTPPPNTEPEKTKVQMRDELRIQINELVDVSADNIAQCEIIAYGSKPCGGPDTYLLYSTKNTNEASLIDLVARYTTLDEQIETEQGVASTCDITAVPKIELVGGQCQANYD